MKMSLDLNEDLKNVINGFGLTWKQTEIFYYIEYFKTAHDIDVDPTISIDGHDSLKNQKNNWLDKWWELTTTEFIENSNLHKITIYETEESLLKGIKDNYPEGHWFKQVLLEAMLFEPYFPLMYKENNENSKDFEKFPALNNPGNGFNQDEGDKYLDYINTKLNQKEYVKCLRESWDQIIADLCTSLKIGKRQILNETDNALTVTDIDIKRSNNDIAGLIGGGGALKEIIFIKENGTEALGKLATYYNLVYQTAKLLISIKEIFLVDEHNIKYVDSLTNICDQCYCKISNELDQPKLKELLHYTKNKIVEFQRDLK